MLDIKFVRENPEIVKQNIKNKFQDKKLPLVDEVLELDKRNREIKQEVQALRADRNKLSKQIGALMGQGKKEEAEEVKKKYILDIKERAGKVTNLILIPIAIFQFIPLIAFLMFPAITSVFNGF